MKKNSQFCTAFTKKPISRIYEVFLKDGTSHVMISGLLGTAYLQAFKRYGQYNVHDIREV